jgi:hypothetical protein
MLDCSKAEEGKPRLASFPAAMVTIFPVPAILEATTLLALSVQPSVPPRDKVNISAVSFTPISSASMITIIDAVGQKTSSERFASLPSSVVLPTHPKIL